MMTHMNRSDNLPGDSVSRSARLIYRENGYCVIRVPNFFMADPARTLLRVSGCLGEVLVQDIRGTRVKLVEDKGTTIGEGSTSRYSESRIGGNFHTDGVERSGSSPRSFALLCVRQACFGGRLILVDASRVFHELGKIDCVKDVLRKPFPFDRRGDHAIGEPQVTYKSIFDDYADKVVPNYLRRYIEASQQYPDIGSLPESLVQAMDALDAVLEDPSFHIRINLEPSDLVVVDNHRFFHGRSTFWDPAGHPGRLLLRTWIG